MIWIAVSIALILWTVALLHLFWALGGLWPAQSAQELARMVVGVEREGAMPGRALTLVVAVLIALAGLWPLLYLGVAGPDLISGLGESRLIGFGMWLLVLVFGLRGAVTYLPGAWLGGGAEPFRTLNRRYYSPLIGLIGVGYLILLLG